jgi:hypothetical protein
MCTIFFINHNNTFVFQPGDKVKIQGSKPLGIIQSIEKNKIVVLVNPPPSCALPSHSNQPNKKVKPLDVGAQVFASLSILCLVSCRSYVTTKANHL